MSELTRKQRWTEAIVTGLIVAAVWAGIAYLSAVSSPWLHPIFYGFIGASLAFVACVAVLLLRRVPRRQVIPTTKNIESCVRAWLDNYKVAVQSDPGDGVFFRFHITLDNGTKVTVLRSRKTYCEYVQLLIAMGIHGNDMHIWDSFTQDEKTEILLDIKTELARHGMGYSGLDDPPTNFQMFRRVPIQHNLTEYIFMSMVGDVEAARNLVLLSYLKKKHEKEKSGLRQPPISGIPIRELPPTSA